MIARFLSVDPLSPEYPMLTPYQFASNTPIVAIDVDGLELLLVNEDEPVIYNGGSTITDQSAIHVVAHGYQGGLVDDIEGKYIHITNGKAFKPLLEKSDLYDELSKSGELCVVLHSCRTGRARVNNDNSTTPSIAQKLSQELSIKIIAPDERAYFTSTEAEGPWVTKFTDPANHDYLPGTEPSNYGTSTKERGNWLVYNKGILVEVYEGSWKPKANPNQFQRWWYGKTLNYSITAEALNLRGGAGTSHEINGNPLERGALVSPTGNVEGKWLEVKTNDSRTGWIHSNYAKPEYDEGN